MTKTGKKQKYGEFFLAENVETVAGG